MYRVLYRKYRPYFFADVVGQSQITETLKNELKSNRIAHAYLFTGSRGTGKTTCSKILAKAVNCLNPKDGDPCGECEMCRGIDDGSILDVVEIDAASNNGVDDIRILREEANFTPANTKYRVYIIDEVHMLSIGAFNALLKILEEPPPHVIFILATTEIHKLPATILSRCQRFDFHRISPQDISKRLEYVCQCENVQIDSQASLLIAGIADGALRDSLSLLDQCMGHSNHITEDIVRKTAGLADKSHLISMTAAIMSQDYSKAVEIVDELYKSSKDMARLCEELIEHYRALMLIKTMKAPRDILVMSEDDFEIISRQALAIPLSKIIYTIDIFQSAFEKMMKGVNRRTEMEMTVLKLCSMPENQDVSGLEERISLLEQIVNNIKTQPATYIQPTAQPAIKNKQSAPAKRSSDEETKKLTNETVPMTQWADIVEDIKKSSKIIGAGFDGSTAYINSKYILVDSKNDICFELLKKAEYRNKMEDSIKRITGKEYKIERYSQPDKKKKDDPLTQLVSDLKSAGIPVDEK